MGGRTGRGDEEGIGASDCKNAHRREVGVLEGPPAEAGVGGHFDMRTEVLADARVGAVAFLEREDVDLGPAIAEVGAARLEIRRRARRAVGPRPDRIGAAIGAARRVEHDDAAGRAVEAAAIRAAPGRQIAGGGVVAVRRVQRRLMLILVGHERRPGVPPRPDEMGRQQVFAAALRGRRAQPGFLALIAPSQDDIDHARHRVRSVKGRGSVEQHIDTLDRPARDRRDVGELPLHPGASKASSVDQNEGRVRPESPQVHARRRRGVAAERVRTQQQTVGRRVSRIGLGQPDKSIGDRGVTASVEVRARDHGDGGRRFTRPSQKRPGDDDLIDEGGVVGRRLLCRSPTQDDHARPTARPDDAASREQAIQRRVRRVPSAQSRRPQTGHEVGGVEDLYIGLPGVSDQRRVQRPAGNVELASRLRLDVGGEGHGGDGNERDAGEQVTGADGHERGPLRRNGASNRRRSDVTSSELGPEIFIRRRIAR